MKDRQRRLSKGEFPDKIQGGGGRGGRDLIGHQPWHYPLFLHPGTNLRITLLVLKQLLTLPFELPLPLSLASVLELLLAYNPSNYVWCNPWHYPTGTPPGTLLCITRSTTPVTIPFGTTLDLSLALLLVLYLDLPLLSPWHHLWFCR